jgi:hypothetical protein
MDDNIGLLERLLIALKLKDPPQSSPMSRDQLGLAPSAFSPMPGPADNRDQLGLAPSAFSPMPAPKQDEIVEMLQRGLNSKQADAYRLSE